MRRALALLVFVLACGSGQQGDAPPPAPGPVPEPDRWVGRTACAGCHAEQHAAWRGSHHDLAMQPAAPASVLGDFDDARFAEGGVEVRFFRRGDGYWLRAAGRDGAPREFRVAYTFGAHPVQQLLVDAGEGRYQAFPVAWDVEAARWIDLQAEDPVPPGDEFHWTGRFQRWNAMCADCHSTGLERGYRPETDSYRTTWHEIDVGCEACHGPGSRHAADPTQALPVALPAPDAGAEVEACAPCHARRGRVSGEARWQGDPLLDHFAPATLRPGLYHADGQILDEVFVYGSFVQSRMHAAGVRCSDCHEPHSLELRADGNAVCASCHGERPDPRFAGVAPRVEDSPAHHFHPAEGPGSRCVDCHMPARTYMRVDPRRDHSMRVPRPDLAARIGTPDACTGCHADRDPAWAAERVAEWYGEERRRGVHWGDLLAAGRAGDPRAGPALAALAADTGQPAIVRATAVELLRPYGPPAAPSVAASTASPDPLVRSAAAGALRGAPPELAESALGPLLEDRVRAVRVAAASAYASLPEEARDPARAATLDAAVAELIDAELAQGDLPSAHLNLAVLHADLGRPEAAERAYRRALVLDPAFLPARSNLALLYSRLGRNADAERELRAGLARGPEHGELHYSLGLLLAEEGRMEEAADSLQRARERLPGRPRVRYNLGLALHELGRDAEAADVLREAAALAPGDPSIAAALRRVEAPAGP